MLRCNCHRKNVAIYMTIANLLFTIYLDAYVTGLPVSFLIAKSLNAFCLCMCWEAKIA